MVHVQALYETGKWSLHPLAKRYDVSLRQWQVKGRNMDWLVSDS